VKVADLDEIHSIRLHRLELEFAPDSPIPEAAIRSAAGVEDVSVAITRSHAASEEPSIHF